jgi:hypothetical protein
MGLPANKLSANKLRTRAAVSSSKAVAALGGVMVPGVAFALSDDMAMVRVVFVAHRKKFGVETFIMTNPRSYVPNTSVFLVSFGWL